ncbi:MAG TPA: WbqC family protein [Kiritimatiellia bacterium]|nr:WbqC family protein [Kiritimatiellia bacterium]
MKKVAILQSNYIPWKGYFDLIHRVDDFVLFDDMQYTRRDWRNRNKIKTANGLLWLTIPVDVKGKYFQAIKDTRISDPGWNQTHWKTICHAYSRAPFFSQYKDFIGQLYAEATFPTLSEINFHFLKALCKLLDIQTSFHWSMDFQLAAGKSERLLGICKDLGATHYLSGPAAKDYLDTSIFAAAGIAVEWMDYSHYPEYPQLHPPFEHGVSILDVIFNVGERTSSLVKTGNHHE